MVRSDSRSAVPSAYNAFLYASVGEDTNGMLLTVLSVLARQNLDPWEEAAHLSRLSNDNARRKLTSLITTSVDQLSTVADRTAIAARLMALLPGRSAGFNVPQAAHAAHAAPAAARVPGVLSSLGAGPGGRLWLIAAYIALMVFGQWMVSSVLDEPKEQAHSAAQAPAPGEDKINATP